MWQAKIETPQKASVGDLRRWLSDFGDKNRQHFETNMVEKKLQTAGNIRRKIQVLEKGISTSYSSSSVSGSSSNSSTTTSSSSTPGSVGCVSNNNKHSQEGTTSNDRLLLLAPAPTPVFREFVNDSNNKPGKKMREKGGKDTEGKEEATSSSQELENYRVVAIGKNNESPQKKTLMNESRFTYPEDIDEYSHSPFWVDTASWNDPKGLLLPNDSSGTTTATTTSSASAYVDALDTLSLRTGRSDPGNVSFTKKFVRRITPRRSKDDTDVGLNNKNKSSKKKSKMDASIYRKFPLLMCKCVKDDEEDNYGDDDSEIKMLSNYNSSMPRDFASLAADNICTMSSTNNSNMTSSTTFQESFLEDDRRGLVTIECRLSQVFREETTLLNRKDCCPVSPIEVRLDLSSEKRASDRKDERDLQDAENQVTVDNVVRRFGGVAKRNAIQRRKEELEKKWAENRLPSHVRKVKWQPCHSSGTYKKKVVLHYSK